MLKYKHNNFFPLKQCTVNPACSNLFGAGNRGKERRGYERKQGITDNHCYYSIRFI